MRRVFVLLLAGYIISISLIFPSRIFAKSSEEIFQSAKPSVVRIGVALFGIVHVPSFYFDSETLQFKSIPNPDIEEVEISTALLGSGFVVHSSGYIITNAHVVDISIDTVADYI